MSFAPDLVAAWLAENRSGSLADLIPRLSWLSGADARSVRDWLSALPHTGTADIDWNQGRWRARPITLTPLPGSTNVFLVVGSFSRESARAAFKALVVGKHQTDPGGLQLPSPAWITYSDRNYLAEGLRSLGATYMPCKAESLGHGLQRLLLEQKQSPPSRSADLRRLRRSSATFEPIHAAARHDDGLYEFEAAGRKRFAIVRNGVWFPIDRDSGVHFDIPQHEFPFTWTADVPNRPTRAASLGRLAVNRRTRLPAQHAETAIMCTGLAPEYDSSGCDVYDGVPLRIARKIARTLNRRIDEVTT